MFVAFLNKNTAMKRHLHFLLSFLFIPAFFLSTGAQEETTFTFGVCGGVNQANFKRPEGSLLYPAAGMNATQLGLFVEGLHQNHLNLRVEFNYRRKSADLDIENPGMAFPMSWAGRYDLDYISLLILPEYRIGGRLEWLLNGGIYVGALVNAGFYRREESVNGGQLQGRADARWHFPSTDAGFVLGTGFSYRITEKWQLGLHVRWMRTVPIGDVQSSDYAAMVSISHVLHILPGSKMDKVLNYLAH
jgi:opacity protein-like surface antigen